jgi:hypothetical protein
VNTTKRNRISEYLSPADQAAELRRRCAEHAQVNRPRPREDYEKASCKTIGVLVMMAITAGMAVVLWRLVAR